MTLADLRSAMQRYATRFDAARITARDAARVVDDPDVEHLGVRQAYALAQSWKRSGRREQRLDLDRARLALDGAGRVQRRRLVARDLALVTIPVIVDQRLRVLQQRRRAQPE